jgi:O-antigen ligase
MLFFIGILPFVSILWSPDYYNAFRFYLVFAASAFTAIGSAVYFTPRALLQVVTRAALLSVLGSVVVIVVFPIFGIHNATDIIQSVHAGDLRGIFDHKNQFGLEMGIALLLFTIVPKIWILSGVVRYLLIFLAILLLALSRSASAAVFTGATLLIVWITIYRFTSSAIITTLLRLLLILALMIAILWIVVVASDGSGVESALEQFLGRDLTLTGRVPVWEYILSMVNNPLWFGLGYHTGFDVNIAPILSQIFGPVFSDPHNGYIDTYVSLGVVGLSFFLFITFWALFNACRLLSCKNYDLKMLAQCAFGLVIFYLLASLTESVLSIGAKPIFVNCFTFVAAMIVNGRRIRRGSTSQTRTVTGLPLRNKARSLNQGHADRNLKPGAWRIIGSESKGARP